MSLQIYVSHTGQRLTADPVAFDSLDAFRSWISKSTSIPPQDQVLLSTRGKHVKLQALLTDKEIFVYDRDLFTLPAPQDSTSAIPPVPLPEPFTPSAAPDTLNDQNDLRAWYNLFRTRRDWAAEVARKCKSMSQAAQVHMDEQTIIDRGVRIASSNHESIIRSYEQQLGEARTWFEDVAREQETNLKTWETELSKLGSIPAIDGFSRFITKQDQLPLQDPSKVVRASTTLRAFVDPDAIRGAAVMSRSVTKQLEESIQDIRRSVERVADDYNQLMSEAAPDQSRSGTGEDVEPQELLNEADQIAKKIASDYEHVQTVKSVAQVSKMALLHTRNFLPNLISISEEMSDLQRRVIEKRNNVAISGIERMQIIATIESVLADVKTQLSSLGPSAEGGEAFELLAFPSKLPYIYGMLLVEAVRRQEWVDKMRKDSALLAEEMAGYQEEEERRRKRWLKSIGDVVNVDTVQGKVLGIEINLRGEERPWPEVSRADLDDYLQTLRRVKGMEETIEPLSQAAKDLDRPTKQQVKRVKNFAKGSVHEASFGKGSLMLRGEDDLKVLKDANARLEEDLKGSKSRVRKLEDLLHRQSQLGRLSMGSGAPPPSLQASEPQTPDQGSYVPSSPRQADSSVRRPSISSRRFSSTQTAEDKALTKRMLALEAELTAEKDRAAYLEKVMADREKAEADLRSLVNDANSTKKDIMDNMEAQQKEFADERRALEREIEHHRFKVEEVEDELDRILGSRDNERTGTESKMDQVRKAAAEDIQKAKERAEAAEARARDLEQQLKTRDQIDTERQASLISIHNNFGPTASTPSEFGDLLNGLEDLSRRALDQLRDLEQAVTVAKMDNDALRSSSDEHKAELTSKLEAREVELQRANEARSAEAARASSLTNELEEERKHLHDLRSKFADGETGSEALRQRVTEEEAKVHRLSSDLAAAKSNVNSLDVELMVMQNKQNDLQKNVAATEERLQQRSQRAKEVSQKMYAQNERLRRLLETLGFAISYQDDGMVVQRASKAGMSQTLNETMASVGRGVSSPPSRKVSIEDSGDLSVVRWMDHDESDREAEHYASYLASIERFNLSIFTEAISKRMRDIEHTARKWQKEARSYRDKSHRFQSDSHDKIAFRSFKEGDLALFLPTRNQATRPWAAFNVGAPHYFLREQDAHRLQHKEWLVARISKIEERVVDLSKSKNGDRPTSAAGVNSLTTNASDGITFEDNDNPFELSDGLRWYLLDAAEEKSGAPSTPGLGKTTVAAANVDARGSVATAKKPGGLGLTGAPSGASKTLEKSLESRRSSTNSKKSLERPQASLGGKKPSSEAIASPGVDGASPELGSNGAAMSGTHGPSGLRDEVGQQSSSPSKPLPASAEHAATVRREFDAEENNNSQDPTMKARSVSHQASPFSKTRHASPSKATAQRSASESPTKMAQKEAPGVWDSLWKFDVSFESGKGKK